MFYMADVKMQEGGRDWVACKACSVEEFPSGKFNFGRGDAISEMISLIILHVENASRVPRESMPRLLQA